MDGDDKAWVEIKLSGPLNRQIAPAKADPAADQRRQDVETGRRAAQEFCMEALHTVVHSMRHSPDENLRLKAATSILDRGWGKPKPLTEEEKKGIDSASILDMLAAMSKDATAVENEAASTKLIEVEEDEDTSYFDADAILVEAEQEGPKNGQA